MGDSMTKVKIFDGDIIGNITSEGIYVLSVIG
jgi:hypothetical protein